MSRIRDAKALCAQLRQRKGGETSLLMGLPDHMNGNRVMAKDGRAVAERRKDQCSHNPVGSNDAKDKK